MIPKKNFIQMVTIIYTGLFFITLFLNKFFFKQYFPHPVSIDFHLLYLSIIFSAVLITIMYFLITYDQFIIPGILTELRKIKYLIFELTTIEKIVISLLAGLSEEILFRGFLQPLLGVTMASVLFGFTHFVTFGYFLLATGIGFFLGGVFYYSGNIFVPVAVHALYNIFAFSLLKKIFLEEERTGNREGS